MEVNLRIKHIGVLDNITAHWNGDRRKMFQPTPLPRGDRRVVETWKSEPTTEYSPGGSWMQRDFIYDINIIITKPRSFCEIPS